jgi:hypothetical protein
MAKFKLLRDLFRFPGFVPLPTIRGVFGDPLAAVITLQRRRKKRPAGSAARCIAATTTSGADACAIFPAGTSVSISTSSCVESSAHGVAV